MAKKDDRKVSEVYFKPRDRFYEFLEQHETLGKQRRKAEQKGAVIMVIFFCIVITIAFATHKEADYSLIDRIFN